MYFFICLCPIICTNNVRNLFKTVLFSPSPHKSCYVLVLFINLVALFFDRWLYRSLVWLGGMEQVVSFVRSIDAYAKHRHEDDEREKTFVRWFKTNLCGTATNPTEESQMYVCVFCVCSIKYSPMTINKMLAMLLWLLLCYLLCVFCVRTFKVISSLIRFS